MLLLVYRSIATVLIVPLMVVLELSAARGRPSSATTTWIGLDLRDPAAGHAGDRRSTDYAIFLIGRYQKPDLGEDKETAITRCVPRHRACGAGLGTTIAGAMLCLHFTKLPYSPDPRYPDGGRHDGGRPRH